MDLARAYGTELYTGVFYKNPNPPPTYDALVKLRHAEQTKHAVPRNKILDAYLQK
jgi:2-oxoglutarate ferredoxin oxidoreductase subunit beta